jgi:hypothetical protein
VNTVMNLRVLAPRSLLNVSLIECGPISFILDVRTHLLPVSWILCGPYPCQIIRDYLLLFVVSNKDDFNLTFGGCSVSFIQFDINVNILCYVAWQVRKRGDDDGSTRL